MDPTTMATERTAATERDDAKAHVAFARRHYEACLRDAPNISHGEEWARAWRLVVKVLGEIEREIGRGHHEGDAARTVVLDEDIGG